MGGLVALVVIVALGVGIYWWATRRERYQPPPAATQALVPTSEVHVDPETGRRQRVWVDPQGGGRRFLDEPVAPGTPGYHRQPALPVPHATRLPSGPPPQLLEAPPPENAGPPAGGAPV